MFYGCFRICLGNERARKISKYNQYLPDFLRRHFARVFLSLGIVLLALTHVAGPIRFEFVDRMELFAYDARLNLMMPSTKDPRIVIVDIDEKSLLEQGRWPWSRDRLASMVDTLFDRYQINVLGFDVVFAEKDESSGLRNIEELARTHLKADSTFQSVIDRVRSSLDYDQRFADSLKGRKVVLGYYFSRDARAAAGVGALPEPVFVSGRFKGKNIDFIPANSYGANLPQLQANARTAGHFNPEPDVDGITRRVALLVDYQGAQYEALSLAVARIALGLEKIEPGFATGLGVGKNYAGLEWITLAGRKIPVDANVTALVPYRGKQGSFPYVSATDVLQGRVSPETLKGAIVLVGTTAPGLMDLRATPVQNVYPGVEVHANMIAGMLDQKVLERPAYTAGAEFVMVLLVGVLLSLMLPAMNPISATVATVSALAVVTGLNLWAWQSAQVVLPLASVMLLIVLIFVLNMSYGFFVESRGKRQLAGLFGQYVPPELVDEMAKNPDAFTVEGENREMTVLFSDVRGFTTISEGLDPKQLTQLMNEFLTPMTHVIHKRRGTIDKYMGDCIMAFWGAPLADPNHAKHALEAAVGMIESLTQLQAEFKAKGWPPIEIGVGLNTGDMTVGNMGSEFRMAYTVMGDAVNLGSRLEGLTKEYGVHIIVGENTREKVPDYLFRELDLVRVKGKDKPVAIYEPICLMGQEDKAIRDELKLYREACRLYRTQNWDLAELQFINLQKLSPQRKLYALYIERIRHYRAESPGDGWDGAFTFKTK